MGIVAGTKGIKWIDKHIVIEKSNLKITKWVNSYE